MRSQTPLTNKRTGETVGRLTTYSADSAAGSITLGNVPGLLRAAVKRGDAVSIVPAENIPDDECQLPDVIVADAVDDVDDLADLFGSDDIATEAYRIARTVVAENVPAPHTATLTIGDETVTYALVWHLVGTTSAGAPRFRASLAEPYYSVNGAAWTVHVGASYAPKFTPEVPGYTDETSGEWIPAEPAVIHETGTLRFRPRITRG